MQVYGNCPNFGQGNVQIRYWIFLELLAKRAGNARRKQQRLELPILLKSRKTKPHLAKILPSVARVRAPASLSVQLFDGLLKSLRRNQTQPGEFLFGFR
jgi:hypothetical protein